MIICSVCIGYIRPSEDFGKEICSFCVARGYYIDKETGAIRYPPIDDTPLARKIRKEIEDCEAK